MCHLSARHGQCVRHLPHGDAVVPQPVRQSEGVEGQSQDGAGVVPQRGLTHRRDGDSPSVFNFTYIKTCAHK